MLALAADRLKSTTATPPSLIGLAHTSVSPKSRSLRPWEPPQSWLTAMTSALRMMPSVCADIERRSLPSSRGELSRAHRLKCAVYSVLVIPPLPTSSMSGSLKPLLRANGSSPFCWSSRDSTLPQLSEMSPVVRHRLPPARGAKTHGSARPQLQML